ncbi:MAG: hypothetical protein WA130_17580 [Candidatus Methanoperedens sp.]
MSNDETGEDFYYSESTVVPVLLKQKKLEDIEPPLNFIIDEERYKRTKVKRKTLRYVPKQD